MVPLHRLDAEERPRIMGIGPGQPFLETDRAVFIRIAGQDVRIGGIQVGQTPLVTLDVTTR